MFRTLLAFRLRLFSAACSRRNWYKRVGYLSFPTLFAASFVSLGVTSCMAIFAGAD